MSDVRPFEEYKEMIQDMSKEEMIKGLYNLSARVIKQENIIKEVREYFENHTFDYDDLMLIKPSDVLEILEKEK